MDILVCCFGGDLWISNQGSLSRILLARPQSRHPLIARIGIRGAFRLGPPRGISTRLAIASVWRGPTAIGLVHCVFHSRRIEGSRRMNKFKFRFWFRFQLYREFPDPELKHSWEAISRMLTSLFLCPQNLCLRNAVTNRAEIAQRTRCILRMMFAVFGLTQRLRKRSHVGERMV